jgi:hypothetical protein
MLRALLIPIGGFVAAGCAASSLHTGKTALAGQEAVTVTASADKGSGEGFRRFWKSPQLKPWRFLKWDSDRSSVGEGAPPLLLQEIRDEIGRLNQRAATGDDLVLTVTVYLYHGGGWFSDAQAHYELVARNPKGTALWVADDVVRARPDGARTLADTEEEIIAREIAQRVRRAFGL